MLHLTRKDAVILRTGHAVEGSAAAEHHQRRVGGPLLGRAAVQAMLE